MHRCVWEGRCFLAMFGRNVPLEVDPKPGRAGLVSKKWREAVALAAVDRKLPWGGGQSARQEQALKVSTP